MNLSNIIIIILSISLLINFYIMCRNTSEGMQTKSKGKPPQLNRPKLK